MKTVARILLCAAILGTAFAARAERTFNQAELDALLAPIALYPDAVLSNVLVAASYPQEVREAAAWTRDNEQLRGDDALRAIQPAAWQPSVKALVPFPELLARMDESPDWLRDLGEAYRVHGPYVMDTVQALRRRAQASGYLRSDERQAVYDEGGAIAIAPASPQVVYVPYYDPYVAYGGWWWPAYRPVVWAPWPVFGAFISVGFVATHFDWGHRRVVVVDRPVFVNRPVYVNHVNRPGVAHQRPVVQQHPQRPPAVEHRSPAVRGPTVIQHPQMTRTQLGSAPEPRRDNGGPSPAQREQQKFAREREKARAPQQGSNRVPEDRRQPIVRPQSQPKGAVGHAPQNQNQNRGNGRHRD